MDAFFVILFPLPFQVVGKGVLGSAGIVMSINEQEGIATVKFPSCEYRRACKASDILTVPISRLCTPRSEVHRHATFFLSMIEKKKQTKKTFISYLSLLSAGSAPL